MYQYFRDVAKDVGKVFAYTGCLHFLRETHDWALTVTANNATTRAGYENNTDTNPGDSQRASSFGENNVAHAVTGANGSGASGESTNSDVVTGSDTIGNTDSPTRVVGCAVCTFGRHVGTEGEQTGPVRPVGSERARELSSQSHALETVLGQLASFHVHRSDETSLPRR